MSKLHTPGDPRSSPYEPMIGHPVLFRPARNTADGRDLKPGVITRVYKDTDKDLVDVCVFTPTGIYHVMRVPYSEDPEDQKCWFWPEPLQRRQLAIKSASNVIPGKEDPASSNKEALAKETALAAGTTTE